jgi:DNA-directed RNA polymerase subunit RPC12/RpoP
MVLSSQLAETEMSYECTDCGFSIVRKGSWYKCVQYITCPQCSVVLPWGYEQKLKLFARYEPTKSPGSD